MSRVIDCMYCIRLAFHGGLAYTGCEASRNSRARSGLVGQAVKKSIPGYQFIHNELWKKNKKGRGVTLALRKWPAWFNRIDKP